jgi:hypothetical protein
MQMQFLFASIRVHSRLKFCSCSTSLHPNHNLFPPPALKIGKPRMDANEREGESGQLRLVFAFIRVHSRLRFCSCSTSPRPNHNLFPPPALKIRNPRMDANEREGESGQLRLLFASILVHSRLKFWLPLDLSPPQSQSVSPSGPEDWETTNGRQ